MKDISSKLVTLKTYANLDYLDFTVSEGFAWNHWKLIKEVNQPLCVTTM